MFGLFKKRTFEEDWAELEKMEKEVSRLMSLRPTSHENIAAFQRGCRLQEKTIRLKVECCKKHNQTRDLWLIVDLNYQ